MSKHRSQAVIVPLAGARRVITVFLSSSFLMSRSVRKCCDSQSLSKWKSNPWQAREHSFVPSGQRPSVCSVSSAQRVLTSRVEEHSERLERRGSKHTGMFYWSAQDGRKPTNMRLNNLWGRREETEICGALRWNPGGSADGQAGVTSPSRRSGRSPGISGCMCTTFTRCFCVGEKQVGG